MRSLEKNACESSRHSGHDLGDRRVDASEVIGAARLVGIGPVDERRGVPVMMVP